MTTETSPDAGQPSFVRYLLLSPLVVLMLWAAVRWPHTAGAMRWIAAGLWMLGAYLVSTLGIRFAKTGTPVNLVLAALIAAWIAVLMLRYGT